MAEFLPFWPKAAIAAYLGVGGDAYIYSRVLPTNGFTEVILQLEIDADFGSSNFTNVYAFPQISNDGVNWADKDTGIFTLSAQGTFPKQITEKYTEIGTFMRLLIKLHNGDGAANILAATVMLSGAGRS